MIQNYREKLCLKIVIVHARISIKIKVDCKYIFFLCYINDIVFKKEVFLMGFFRVFRILALIFSVIMASFAGLLAIVIFMPELEISQQLGSLLGTYNSITYFSLFVVFAIFSFIASLVFFIIYAKKSRARAASKNYSNSYSFSKESSEEEEEDKKELSNYSSYGIRKTKQKDGYSLEFISQSKNNVVAYIYDNGMFLICHKDKAIVLNRVDDNVITYQNYSTKTKNFGYLLTVFTINKSKFMVGFEDIHGLNTAVEGVLNQEVIDYTAQEVGASWDGDITPYSKEIVSAFVISNGDKLFDYIENNVPEIMEEMFQYGRAKKFESLLLECCQDDQYRMHMEKILEKLYQESFVDL